MPIPSKQMVQPPITRSDPKSKRGFNHRWTACLLCPRRDISKFNKNPEYVNKLLIASSNTFCLLCRRFMDKVNEGTIQMRASEWPSFLYDFNMKFDRNDEEYGLFRGYLLVRVCLSFSSTISIALHLIGLPSYIYGAIVSY
jgi:hypothetical protein